MSMSCCSGAVAIHCQHFKLCIFNSSAIWSIFINCRISALVWPIYVFCSPCFASIGLHPRFARASRANFVFAPSSVHTLSDGTLHWNQIIHVANTIARKINCFEPMSHLYFQKCRMLCVLLLRRRFFSAFLQYLRLCNSGVMPSAAHI